LLLLVPLPYPPTIPNPTVTISSPPNPPTPHSPTLQSICTQPQPQHPQPQHPQPHKHTHPPTQAHKHTHTHAYAHAHPPTHPHPHTCEGSPLRGIPSPTTAAGPRVSNRSRRSGVAAASAGCCCSRRCCCLGRRWLLWMTICLSSFGWWLGCCPGLDQVGVGWVEVYLGCVWSGLCGLGMKVGEEALSF